jgi:hypothetical protein
MTPFARLREALQRLVEAASEGTVAGQVAALHEARAVLADTAPPIYPAVPVRWVWSRDGEIFTDDEYDTLESLIAEVSNELRGEGAEDGEIFYAGKKIPGLAANYLQFDSGVIEQFFEYAGEQAHADVGEWAEEFPDVSAEHQQWLETALQEQVAIWVSKAKIEARFFSVAEAQPYAVESDDGSEKDHEADMDSTRAGSGAKEPLPSDG